VVDIVKWAGPSTNWGMKLHEVAPYLLWPGWFKVGQMCFYEINLDEWNALSDKHQKMLERVATHNTLDNLYREAKEDMEYYLKYLDYGCTMTTLPVEDQQKLAEAAKEVMQEYSDENPLFKEIYENQKQFLSDWHAYVDMTRPDVSVMYD
ncbi:unnamed protein product, partial [marine sediment metagenome]